VLVLAAQCVTAQTPINEDEPWPRVRSTNGNTVTLHLPQVERWTSNSFAARAVVGVKPREAKAETLGVVWFEANGVVDHSNRLVTLDRLEITKARFPEAPDGGTNALALVRELFPGGTRTVSLDYLITALGFVQAAARQGAQGLKHKPPDIIWATNRTVLVLLQGEPILRPVPDSPLEHVVNTPALIVRIKGEGKFYLNGAGRWFAAESIKGPWSLAQTVPPEVSAASPDSAGSTQPAGVGPPPRILISTSPAELLLSDSLPDFRPIRGTALQYAADSDSQLFYHTEERQAYLLLSGRWFKAPSLKGPWTYVAPHDLPPDFAKIPPSSPQAIVLASVPGTRQSELALVANSAPTTATVSRRDAKIELTYDGEPKFKPIPGTAMSYAVNSGLPVIQQGDHYYAVDDAVWFVASSPTGPWEVAAEVPEEIYTIPPSSPVYYATFARVYDADEDTVETGYTPGYTGSYEDEETVVYGTGYEYEDWEGDEYYGWGWTWGYSYWYVPWYGWWIWRPWWNDPYGLRAAVIDNIYDRWQSRPGVMPHDRPMGSAAATLQQQGWSGYPALYGRYKGATRARALSPPTDTLALNPYTRPKTPLRSGEIPHGAQLLTTLRQSPGGGRDLYASPDGNVYLRRADGWYRRQSGGNWGFVAPAQGTLERGPVGGARGAAAAGSSGMNRIASGPGYGRGERVPDAGTRLRAQEVARLEREHYARTLGQMRAQNVRQSYNINRPVRAGGRR
jgi:hypothetical protein